MPTFDSNRVWMISRLFTPGCRAYTRIPVYPALKTANPAGTVVSRVVMSAFCLLLGLRIGCVGRRRCFYVCTFCIVYPLVAVLSRHHECLVDGVKVDVHLGPSPGGTFLQVLTSAHLSRTPPEDNGCLLYTSPSPRDKRQSRMPSSA